MSVVVRMEMPNGCHDCKLRNMVGNCPIPMFDGQDKKKIWKLEECFQRPPWCPIICALPENHGRLVDMRDIDSMMEDIQTTSDESGLYGLYYRDDFDFDGLPTIVPTERSET